MRLVFCTHRFRVSGLNLERFVNLCQQQSIPLLRVHRTDSRAMTCECYSSDLSALQALAQERGWKMEILTPLGLSAFITKLKKRPGIPAGIAAMLVCMAVFSQFVWRVDVQGAGAYRADIVSFLEESGYTIGTRIKKVDAKALETALSYRYPKIAWFNVYASNMTLVVRASQGAPMPEMPNGQSGDLVADRNGIIHSIRVTAGTAAVKAGDVVQKGDVLIRGTERARDEQTTPVQADGVVLARCWDQFTAAIPTTEIISAETGREHRYTRIHTPWFDFPFRAEEPAFLSSNLSITQTPVGGVFFPVFLQTVIHREVSMEIVPRDERLVRAEAAEAALKQLKTALFHDDIIDKWVDYCMIEDDILAATVTAERLVDIGVFSAP